MVSTSILVPEQVMLLEQGTLKTPVESLRRIQKTTQKTWEYNLGPTSAFKKDLSELFAASTSDRSVEATAARTQTIDSMLGKMRGLKRKLSELSTQSIASNEVATRRLNHLRALPESMNSPEYAGWASTRLSQQLTDYFLRSNPPLKESAQALAKEQGIEALVDDNIWSELARVEDGLRDRRLEEGLKWTGENRSSLRKSKSSLEFTIHLQAFIELCRTRSHAAAIDYAKKNLSPSALAESGGSATGSQMLELTRAMALLAFGPETTCTIYQDLYSVERWASLLALFRTSFLTLHSLPAIPLLHLSLQAGISSLKTPICCPLPTLAPGSTIKPRSAITEGHSSPNCPICSSSLKILAPEVPYSHHVNTTIVCGITGKVVGGEGEDDGELLALISADTGEGNVYSKEGLIQQSVLTESSVARDPVTGETFEWDELKKVYVI